MKDLISFIALVSEGKVTFPNMAYNRTIDQSTEGVLSDYTEFVDSYVHEEDGDPFLFIKIKTEFDVDTFRVYAYKLDGKGNIDQNGELLIFGTENIPPIRLKGRPSYYHMLHLNSLLDTMFGDV